MPGWMSELALWRVRSLGWFEGAPVNFLRATAFGMVLDLLSAAVGAAQGSSPNPTQSATSSDGLRVHAITLVHRRAIDALQVVEPLLSPRGTIELQAGNNSLVVRDTLAALTRIVSAVRAFDRPARPVVLELELLRGQRSPPQGDHGLARPRLAARIQQLLPYQHIVGLARVRLTGVEGEGVNYELHGGYRVSFAFGNWMPDQGIRLQRFRIVRLGPPEERQLLGTSVHMRPSQPLVLALTRDEAAERALLVVLELDAPAASGS